MPSRTSSTTQKPRVGSQAARAATKHASQDRFLAAYAEHCTVVHACRATGIGRRTHYGWLESDPAYAARFADVKDDAVESLEAEARRRAAEGVLEPVYQGGKKVGSIRKYSDTLLIFLLKGAKPDVYRDRVEHTGKNGGPIETTARIYLPDNGRSRPSANA
jgi:hypothetical protein